MNWCALQRSPFPVPLTVRSTSISFGFFPPPSGRLVFFPPSLFLDRPVSLFSFPAPPEKFFIQHPTPHLHVSPSNCVHLTLVFFRFVSRCFRKIARLLVYYPSFPGFLPEACRLSNILAGLSALFLHVF